MKTITMYQAEDSSVHHTKQEAARQDFHIGVTALYWDFTNLDSMPPRVVTDFLLSNKQTIDALFAKMEDDCK